MQFELIRLSVLPRPQMDYLERRKEDRSRFTREEWIRAVFGEVIEFEHRKERFRYAPGSDEIDGDGEGDAVFGRIGRKILTTENDPDQNLKEVEHEAWVAARVIIDPKHHEDGQKVGVEHKSSIGSPIPLFEALVNCINKAAEPFALEANAIVPTESFWDFVEKNDGSIISVEFEFVAPNMFGGADDYDKEMRDMQANERAQKAKLTIEGRDGLNLRTEKVKAAANYTSRGTGSIRAKTKTRRTYSSRAKAQKVSIDNREIAATSPGGLLKKLFDLIKSA